MFSKEIRLDNTKRSCFRECKRKGYLQYIRNLRSSQGSMALLFGSTWHGFQEGFYGCLKEYGWERRDLAIQAAILKGKEVWDKEISKQDFTIDYRNFDTACQAFLAYIQHFEHDAGMLKVIHTEQVFACPLELNGAEERKLFGHLPPIVFTGKLDLQAELSYSPWIIEHKTTGMNIDQQALRLNRSAQIMGYAYAGPRVLDFKPEGCLISFLHASARRNKDGVYGKITIDFKRVPQLFSEGDLQVWRRSFIHLASEVYNCWQTGYWDMNHDQCYGTYGACSYVRLCEQNRPIEEINTEGFVEIPWDVEKEGKEDANEK